IASISKRKVDITMPTKTPKAPQTPKPAIPKAPKPKVFKSEHQLFTDLLDTLQDTGTQIVLLREEGAPQRLYSLLNLYGEEEFATEAKRRQEERNALQTILEPRKREQLRIV